MKTTKIYQLTFQEEGKIGRAIFSKTEEFTITIENRTFKIEVKTQRTNEEIAEELGKKNTIIL